MAEDISRLRIDRDARVRARRRFPWGWLVIVVIAMGAAYAAFGWKRPLQVEAGAVTLAYPSQGYTALNATGYVVAQRKAAVASKATGRLEWLGVREGSTVKQNEVMARLENRDVTAQMQQAEANVNLARANLEQGRAEMREAERAMKRADDLLAKNFVSQAAHDSALARFDKARAAIAGLEASVGVAQANHRASQVAVEQTLIRAPFDGIVLTKNANVGDVITPFSSATGSQAAVVTMADMSTLEVEADVAEASLAKVQLGQPCEIQLDALPDVRFRGMVHRMVPTVDRAKATVTAKIRFVDADARILPEMSAKVSFLEREVQPAERSRRTAVPAHALAERNGRPVVFLLKDGRAVETPVEVGDKLGELVEVRKGVSPGDRVVLKPAAGLRDNAAVTVNAK